MLLEPSSEPKKLVKLQLRVSKEELESLRMSLKLRKPMGVDGILVPAEHIIEELGFWISNFEETVEF